MKKLANSYALALIASIIGIIFLVDKLNILINYLYLIMIALMFIGDIITKKNNKVIILDIVLTLVFIMLIVTMGDGKDPMILLPGLACLMISMYRTMIKV